MLARAASGEIEPLSDETATKICDDLVSFANYGFPESHAWSFALIAYVTAYLKAHQPTEFFIGLLNAQPMGFYPVRRWCTTRSGMAWRCGRPVSYAASWECTRGGDGGFRDAGAADRVALRARRSATR